MNHNQLLGVTNTASTTEIQAAFRKAALETHPDHSDSPEAAEAFARIKIARDELMKRAKAFENAKDSDSIQTSTAAAVKATTNAAFTSATSDGLYDGFTPEEIVYIQKLDRLAMQKPKKSLFHRAKESVVVQRHRKKLKTNNDRLQGRY